MTCVHRAARALRIATIHHPSAVSKQVALEEKKRNAYLSERHLNAAMGLCVGVIHLFGERIHTTDTDRIHREGTVYHVAKKKIEQMPSTYRYDVIIPTCTCSSGKRIDRR